MQLSIQTPQYATTLPALRDVWQAADALGFRAAWLMDHLVPIVEPATVPMLEAWTSLAALASSTRRMRVGVLVSANTFRHPAVLARMAVTIDHVSEGRLDVGLGAAWHEGEHRANGLPFPPIGARLGMLDEACTVLRRLWTEDAVTFDGRFYQLTDAVLMPKPVQRPLPLMVGAKGERRALAVVARHADRWNVAGAPEIVMQKRRILDAHCAAIGREARTIASTVRRECQVVDDALVADVTAYAAAGCDETILGLAPPYDRATIALLERLTRDVMPQVR